MSKFIEPSNEEIKLEKLYQDMGLSDKEYDKVVEILGREPNFTEVGIFSVMWSEHCSYKHSKPFLTISYDRRARINGTRRRCRCCRYRR